MHLLLLPILLSTVALAAAAENAVYCLAESGAPRKASSDKAIDYTQWIFVDAFEDGLQSFASTSGASAGSTAKVSLQPITIRKKLDAASIQLMQAAMDGTMLNMRCDFLSKASDSKSLYFQILLEEVFVSSLSQSADAGEMAIEVVTFSFAKIQVATFALDKNGNSVQSNTAGYDVQEDATRKLRGA